MWKFIHKIPLKIPSKLDLDALKRPTWQPNTIVM